MRARSLAVVGAFLVVSVAAVASATTMRALDLDALSQQADVVVLGRVAAVGSVVVGEGGHLVPRTVTRVRVEERLVGAAPDELRIVEPEGRFGESFIHREGLSAMRRGQQVLLFLRRHGAHGGTYRPVGHAQGAYVLRADRPGAPLRLHRAGDPGLLLGSTKSGGIDLDGHAELERVRAAVLAARAAP